MSVRDKIAGFGGPASTGIGGGGGGRPNGGFGSTARIGTNVPTSSSNARASPSSSSSLGGDPDSVSKLKVPDVFRNATKPADIPVAVSMEVAPSAAPKKWATPAGSVKLGVSNGGGFGASSVGSAPAGAPGWKARNGDAAPDTTAKRPVSDAAKKPRDVLGLTSAGSAPSLVRPPPAAVESGPTATGSSGGSGGGGRAESGRASPPSRSAKPKAGPRKLNLTRISAEKQRAALCLDKNLEEEGGSGASNGRASPRAATTAVASKPTYGGGSSSTTATNSGGRPAPAAASSNTTRPAAAFRPAATSRPAAASRPAASGRTVGGGAARGGGNGIPSAGSLRSSGHNLW